MAYAVSGDSGQLQRKSTAFLTNSEHISRALRRLCYGRHQHEVIIGGDGSKRAQQYPSELKEEILKAYEESINRKIQVNTLDEIYEEDERLNEILRVEQEVLHQEKTWEEICEEFGEEPDVPSNGEGPPDKECQDHTEHPGPSEHQRLKVPGDDNLSHDPKVPRGSRVRPRSKEPGVSKVSDGHPAEPLPVSDKESEKELQLASRFNLSRLLKEHMRGLVTHQMKDSSVS